jgi:putative phage-type endonuclease
MEIITPADKKSWLELRSKNINSTDVAALFGISPYLTKFELWHRKKRGDVVELEENKRMKWGSVLQDTIAAQIAKDQGWNIRRMDEYIFDKLLRVGSSFDFHIDRTVENENPGLLEIKNVDGLIFRDQWTVDDNGNIQGPLHIELQVQHQLLVSGREYAYIGALVGGNDEKLIYRKRDKAVISAIRVAVCDFWDSIDANTPPEPNFTEDAAFISKLYGYAEPNKVLDVRGDEKFFTMMEKYRELGEEIKSKQESRDAIKAELLTIVGDAEKVTGDSFTISAGVVAECPINYIRSAYRMFKPSWRKVKK